MTRGSLGALHFAAAHPHPGRAAAERDAAARRQGRSKQVMKKSWGAPPINDKLPNFSPCTRVGYSEDSQVQVQKSEKLKKNLGLVQLLLLVLGPGLVGLLLLFFGEGGGGVGAGSEVG